MKHGCPVLIRMCLNAKRFGYAKTLEQIRDRSTEIPIQGDAVDQGRGRRMCPDPKLGVREAGIDCSGAVVGVHTRDDAACAPVQAPGVVLHCRCQRDERARGGHCARGGWCR